MKPIDTLRAEYPGFKIEEMRCNFNGDEGIFLAVTVNDTALTDPFRSECGRFEVNPANHYGVPSSLALAITFANRERLRDRFKMLVEDLIYILERNEADSDPREEEHDDAVDPYDVAEAGGRWEVCKDIREALRARGITITKED